MLAEFTGFEFSLSTNYSLMQLEDNYLIQVFDWVTWAAIQDPRLNIIHHVANERRCSPFAGKILKRKGVKSGIPDICCPIPNDKYHGLYVELKVKLNKLSTTQIEVGKLLSALGYLVRVAWSGEEAIEIIKTYLATSKAPLKLPQWKS